MGSCSLSHSDPFCLEELRLLRWMQLALYRSGSNMFGKNTLKTLKPAQVCIWRKKNPNPYADHGEAVPQ